MNPRPWKPPPTSIRPRQPTSVPVLPYPPEPPPAPARPVMPENILLRTGLRAPPPAPSPLVCDPGYELGRMVRTDWLIHFLTWQGSTWRRIWHLWPAALLLLWWLL
jgi:hypothetical protein